MKNIAVTMALLGAASSVMADPAGLRMMEIDMPHHGSQAGISIWYPTGGGGDVKVVAENPVFYGVDAAIDADVKNGTHPIVMFSHGMGGTTRAQAWLASGLAARGAIVVSVNHPNSTWGDFDMSKGVNHWTRVADLSVALDRLLADPAFETHVDRSRIMAAGFSYGGWTALSMGGITGNHAGIVATCTAHLDEMAACDTLLCEGVNMQGIDANVWNASYADARITHVTAIDPGFVWGLTAPDVAGLVPNLHMIGFGGPLDRMSATNFDDSGLTALLPNAKVTRFDPAFHFTAMPLCKPAAAKILEEEDDDPVCTDPAGTDRAAVHSEIISIIAEELDL
ncbi:alpha/beta hydrolase family protein [Yoonia sp. SS1-5]|uniref:Alpha/beta hydrolase family protein n=2 Tax=Yoonia rhodophyticola TaxID=3137370 RepID=A0AAN0MAU7_9RHOB